MWSGFFLFWHDKQVTSARNFVEEYTRRYGSVVDQKVIEAIDGLSEVHKELRSLEQAVRDLLQLVRASVQ